MLMKDVSLYTTDQSNELLAGIAEAVINIESLTLQSSPQKTTETVRNESKHNHFFNERKDTCTLTLQTCQNIHLSPKQSPFSSSLKHSKTL